jgi:thiamine pyrophosphokinase
VLVPPSLDCPAARAWGRMSHENIDLHSFVFSSPASFPTALILLNSTSPSSSLPFLRAVRRCASLCIAADGAAGRLYRSIIMSVDGVRVENSPLPSPEAIAALNSQLPNIVCGDWDSIDKESESFYRAAGCTMIADPDDQDSTDLMKCLQEVKRRQVCEGTRYRVIVYGAFGGRFDHEAQNLNCLYTW